MLREKKALVLVLKKSSLGLHIPGLWTHCRCWDAGATGRALPTFFTATRTILHSIT